MLFTRRDEQNRLTAAPSATRTANAVGVALRIMGHIIVDDMADAFNIQATCRNVGGDEDVNFAIFELLNRALTLLLLHVTVDRSDGETARRQFRCKLFRTQFCTGKNNHAVKSFSLQDAR